MSTNKFHITSRAELNSYVSLGTSDSIRSSDIISGLKVKYYDSFGRKDIVKRYAYVS